MKIIYIKRIFTRRNILLLLLLAGLNPVITLAETAPGFTLQDGQGANVSLSDFRGKPLVLHFWASWCPYCKKLQPGLERLASKHKDDELMVLGVNFREDDGVDPQAVLRERGLTFKTLVKGDDVARAYKVRGTPTTVFIRRNGDIAGVTNTADPDDPELERLTAAILE